MVKCGGQQRKEPFKKVVHPFFILWEMSAKLPPNHPTGRESSFLEIGTKGTVKMEKDPELETGIGRNGMKGLLRSPKILDLGDGRFISCMRIPVEDAKDGVVRIRFLLKKNFLGMPDHRGGIGSPGISRHVYLDCRTTEEASKPVKIIGLRLRSFADDQTALGRLSGTPWSMEFARTLSSSPSVPCHFGKPSTNGTAP